MQLYAKIKSHPKVKFIIFYPPYSYLTWELAKERGSFQNCTLFKEYTLKKFLMLPNVEVYDFQNEPFIYNLNNYRDISHYSDKINHTILNKIAKKENRVTKANIEAHLANLRLQRERYRATHPKDVAEIEAFKKAK